MKNTMKRVITLALVLMMIAGLTVTAYAAEENPEAQPASTTAFVIQKELTAYNPDGSSVHAPSIRYSYSIAPGSAGNEITDQAGVKVETYAGITGAEITESVSWSPADMLDASPEGTANFKDITIDLSKVAFPRAGVYRYAITETVEEGAYEAAGVTDGSITAVRYLDVYVNDAGIYGFILMSDNADVTGATAKTEGFVSATDGAGDKLSADSYYTFNVTISKEVKNDAYIKNTHHQFPFTVSFKNDSITAPVQLSVSPSEHAKQDALAAGVINELRANPTIADGASVTYTGIPSGTMVSVSETNDITGATYGVSSSGADTNVQGDDEYQMLFSNETSKDAVLNAQAHGTQNINKTIAFTNTLLVISPTGVVLRVAPYVLMLGVGLVLLVIARKRRLAREA